MSYSESGNAADFIPRHIEPRVYQALERARVVAVVGPRQSGKTTLVRRFSSARRRPFFTLDDAGQRRFAIDDPDGFVRDREFAIIDEVPRAPELLLAIKKTVDERPKAGRFLITGSVDLFKRAVSPDSLAGRVKVIELMPLSQAEIGRFAPSKFLDRLFAGDFPAMAEVGRTENLVERVLCGGYPEAQSRRIESDRGAWLRSYAQVLMERDLPVVAKVDKTEELARLFDFAAATSGSLLNLSTFGSRLGVDGKTVDRWLTLLERLFLMRRIRAWRQSDRKRIVKAPKLQFLDSGLLAAIHGQDVGAIASDRQVLGSLLECFAYSEILKAIALRDDWVRTFHYREKETVEVDFVLERSPGEVVGIEVKARATVRPEDFKGLKRLREICGERFTCGVVVHDGDRVQRMYPGMYAMPIKMLWEA